MSPQGKAQDFVSFYRADVFPAPKKAEGKIAGATIATRGIGAQANEVTTSEFYNKFTDLDAPTSWIQSSDRKPTPRSMRRATHSRRVFRPSSAGG